MTISRGCAGRRRPTVGVNPELGFFGVNLSELMPYQRLDEHAMLGGPVVFARDFGARNVKLRSRFPDRDWYVARLTRANGATLVTLEPYR